MPLSTALLDPIAGANPAGANLRYDPVYDQIKLARTEEVDAPQGDWQRARKIADYALVMKLAGEALAKRSKDLQLAAWLTEALVHREGFAGLRAGLELLHGLIDQFWDDVYPELEDDDAEFRATPLEWVGHYLDATIRFVPLNEAGHGFVAYKESRVVGYEKDTEYDDAKKAARAEALEEGKLTAEEFDESFNSTPKSWYRALTTDLDGALAALDTLDVFGQEKFGDAAPSYYRLRDALQEVRQVAGQLLARKLEADPDPPEPEPEMAAVEYGGGEGGELDAGLGEPSGIGPGGEDVGGAGAGAGASGGAALSPQPRNREDAAARIAAAARFMRAEAPTDPAPYLLLRGFRWGELRAGGGEIDPRLLAAPPTEMRMRLKLLGLDAKWAELLEAAEEVMATPYGRGWLDLQRYVLRALDGLGPEYDVVAAAVRGALRSLLQDLPTLPALTLMDDSPTANAETLAALETVAGGGEGGSPAVAAAVSRAGLGRDPYDRALDLVRGGKPQPAIDLLIREAAQEQSPRARFLRRAQAAGIMVDAGLEAVAMPILDELITQIEKHQLEEWEAGELVAQPLGYLYRSLERLGDDSGTRDSLYLRICRLDPLQAIQFGAAAASSGSESDSDYE